VSIKGQTRRKIGKGQKWCAESRQGSQGYGISMCQSGTDFSGQKPLVYGLVCRV
jgi:hypothetical protein